MEEVIKYLEEIKEHQMNTVQFARSTEPYKLADKALKAINYSQCCTQLKDKPKLTFDEYTENFYICNGFTYESKRTGKLVDVGEITERYRWYSKNL